MPLDRPDLPTLIDRTRADLLARLGVDEALRRADTEVYARVQAGGLHLLYGYLAWVARQILPTTCDVETLIEHGALWGVPRKSAAPASGSVTFTAQAGAVISANAALRALDGTEYTVSAGGTSAGPTITLDVQAVEAAAAGNRTPGQALALVSPIAGVQPVATAGALTGGADIEDAEAWRARILARVRQPPHGGASFDYVTWALEVPGVTRAWCYPMEMGIGTVVVRFMRDDDVNPVPGSGEVAAVQAHIDAVRPVTADVTVAAPMAVPLDFTVTGLSPDAPAVRAAIEAELADLLRREAVPEGGAGEGTILVSHVREAISVAAGESDHVLALPTGNVTHAVGEIATMGTVTWLP